MIRAAAIAALAVGLAVAAPASTDGKTAGTTTTTTTTTTSAPAADPAAEWEAQACTDTHGPITAPDPLPAHDDAKGCQYLLHDWRASVHADALAALASAQAALDEVAVQYRAAADTRNAAVTALKLAEAAVDEAVAGLSPPTTTTTTTTVPPKPPPTTTTTTTVPPRPHHEIVPIWYDWECDHYVGPLYQPADNNTPDYDALDWLDLHEPDPKRCRALLAEWLAGGNRI